MLKSGADTLMVSVHHANQPKSKTNTTNIKYPKSNETSSVSSKITTKSEQTQSVLSSNTAMSSSSSPSSSSASISSVKIATKNKSKSNGTHYTRSSVDSPNYSNNSNHSNHSSSKETNIDETNAANNLKSANLSNNTPPFKRHKSNYTTDNDKEVTSIKYNTPSRVHHNIYPALGNCPTFVQPSPQNAPIVAPQSHNYERPPHSLYFPDKAVQSRPNDEPTQNHHKYAKNYADDNYGSAYSHCTGSTSRKVPHENEYQFQGGTSHTPPIRFCLWFLQGQYCSPCHIVHMVMHKYSFPCGVKNCEYDENLNSGNAPPPYPYPPYNHQQSSEFHGNPSYAHQPNNYGHAPPPPFTSNHNDYYGQYLHENYYLDQSKLPH